MPLFPLLLQILFLALVTSEGPYLVILAERRSSTWFAPGTPHARAESTPRQVLRKPQFVLDERLVDDQLRHRGGQLPPLPLFNLAFEGLEVALDSVYADGKRILNREVLGMLREDRRELSVERQILAHEHSDARGAT